MKPSIVEVWSTLAATAAAEAEKLARRAEQYPDAPQVAMWTHMAATQQHISARYRADVALQTQQLAEAHRIILDSTGRDYQNFSQSDRLGKLGEHSFVAHLQASGSTVIEGPRSYYFPVYDLKAVRDGRQYTVEVKTDLTRSENCYAEWGEGTAVSGVTSTEADYFVIYRPHLGQFYTAPTASLRAQVEDWARKGRLSRTYNRRSGRNTWGYLIPHARWPEIPGAKVIDWQPA